MIATASPHPSTVLGRICYIDRKGTVRANVVSLRPAAFRLGSKRAAGFRLSVTSPR